MKSFKNTTSIIEHIEENNYYYKGNQFESFTELNKRACEHFNSITEDYDDREEYYNHFGVDLNDCRINEAKIEKHFNEEYNDIETIIFYEAYIDSGVNEEDYFHGYIIRR